MADDSNEFSVVQYFADDSYEYVCRWVDAETAVTTAKHLTESVGGRTGTTRKVIITDANDNTNFLWEYRRGVVYPPIKQTSKE